MIIKGRTLQKQVVIKYKSKIYTKAHYFALNSGHEKSSKDLNCGLLSLFFYIIFFLYQQTCS